MCLGLPGRVVALNEGGNLGQVDIAGVIRRIDLSLLPATPVPGQYVLVHSGIALELLPAEQATEAEAWLGYSARAAGPILRDEGAEE
ncbi:MAG TPA: HypC/HybG/HupF family hydrogenase formation chaperone [Jatrophihabitans sp.]|nr:HypC/HybG/HupF family hydrogenase formation chaperone [Jatrophihabitans sp.]